MTLKTPLYDEHVAAGADFAETFGTLLPAHFGDFLAEYQAARKAVALFDTNFRACFSFSGPDARRYLNAILTSNLRDAQPGQGTQGLLLTAQGHILAEVETLIEADRILLLSPLEVRERTFTTLDKFIIMDDVLLEDKSDTTATLDLLGPLAASVIQQLTGVDILSLPVFGHVEAAVDSIPCRAVRHQFASQPAAMLVVGRENLTGLWHRLASAVRAAGGSVAGMQALNSLRLECGVPWFGYDFGDKNIPHDAGLENSHISYDKGCYTGQEIVERVRSRGHVQRRLAELKFHASTAPPVPSKLLFTGKEAASEVGQITSVGFSPVAGQPIGLGYLRREYAAIGTRLDASGIPAEVISPPLAD